MEHDEIRRSLERLASHASAEILAKQSHWGDAILCDGLLYSARALKTDAPVAAAEKWFAPKLTQGPRTNGWFWFWAAEALPALDLREATGDTYARALGAICAKINPGGEFTDVSQQTPPGDFNFYNSIETGTASFATGVCLMALSEALKT
jgi:hypothetical protein